MSENIRHKQVTFILLGGSLLTAVTIGSAILLSALGIENFYLLNVLLYAIEFGCYCLALYIYRAHVSNMLWFNQGLVILILMTLLKIVITVLIYFVMLSLARRYTGSPLLFLLALFGPFVRGFVFELPLIAMAAKIFETDIFQKKNTGDNRVIDNQLN